jgi:hypothetical protein
LCLSVQRENLLYCSEKFAIGKSIVSVIIWEVIAAINTYFSHLVRWPREDDMRQVILDLKSWCGMLLVHGAVDCTHRMVAHYGPCVLQVTMHSVRAFLNLFMFLKNILFVNLVHFLNILGILESKV